MPGDELELETEEVEEVETEEVETEEEAEEVEAEEVEEVEGEVVETTPAPLTAEAIAEAIVRAQQAQVKPQAGDAPVFDWSDPIGSVQKQIQAARDQDAQEYRERAGIEQALLTPFSKKSAEAQAFARQVLSQTPTHQLKDPQVAAGLELMVLGFEAKRGGKRVAKTVETNPVKPTKVGNVPANVREYINNFDKAFPHLKGRMTPEKAKAALGDMNAI